jgi:hypothetical protein
MRWLALAGFLFFFSIWAEMGFSFGEKENKARVSSLFAPLFLNPSYKEEQLCLSLRYGSSDKFQPVIKSLIFSLLERNDQYGMIRKLFQRTCSIKEWSHIFEAINFVIYEEENKLHWTAVFPSAPFSSFIQSVPDSLKNGGELKQFVSDSKPLYFGLEKEWILFSDRKEGLFHITDVKDDINSEGRLVLRSSIFSHIPKFYGISPGRYMDEIGVKLGEGLQGVIKLQKKQLSSPGVLLPPEKDGAVSLAGDFRQFTPLFRKNASSYLSHATLPSHMRESAGELLNAFSGRWFFQLKSAEFSGKPDFILGVECSSMGASSQALLHLSSILGSGGTSGLTSIGESGAYGFSLPLGLGQLFVFRQQSVLLFSSSPVSESIPLESKGDWFLKARMNWEKTDILSNESVIKKVEQYYFEKFRQCLQARRDRTKFFPVCSFGVPLVVNKDGSFSCPLHGDDKISKNFSKSEDPRYPVVMDAISVLGKMDFVSSYCGDNRVCFSSSISSGQKN